MKVHHLLASAAFVFAVPSIAAAAPLPTTDTVNATSADKTDKADGEQTDKAADTTTKAADKEVFSTGVAKGRDRLDSAISTSSLREGEILKLAPQSIGDLLRDIPGVRSEAQGGEGNAGITIRGLPLSSTGAKFVQLEEDGLPILEFGDITFSLADGFLRADINLSQVEVIRGGSASTFASNSPGGIINFQSKTGDVEGGAIQIGSGLDYDQKRIDIDYGAKVSDTLRFHLGGFYRQGEGPRTAGFDAKKGGQVKFNVTKTLGNGYIRLYGKYLDDRTPVYDSYPLAVTGTNADPEFHNVPGFDIKNGSMMSRYFTNTVTLDQNNNTVNNDVRDGQHARYKSIGLETQFEVAGWTVTDRFRVADIQNSMFNEVSYTIYTPEALSLAYAGGPGATFSYASGPLKGTAITNPSTLNGNGLLIADAPINVEGKLDNVTNDLRVSRQWNIGDDELTTTAGIYSSRQQVDYSWSSTAVIHDLRGDGTYALIDMKDASGRALTQNGVYAYSVPGVASLRRRINMDYSVNAPFASANYRFGGVSIGASARYDTGSASGNRNAASFGPAVVTRDMNGDGVISIPEQKVAVLPLTSAQPIAYDFSYLSYSTGVNFRIAEPFAVFARYSRGGRTPADRLLFTSFLNATTGSLTKEDIKVDIVKQAEVGLKYRKSGLTLNLTGFWAKAEDTSVDAVTIRPFEREYKALGLEFEGGYRLGNFSINGGATYTKAEITADAATPAIVGNTPRHQANFIFQATPQFTTDRFSVGAVFIGTTDSYAQDTNLLKVPGYVTTNAFVQVRPADRLLLSLNANNLFNVLALTVIADPTIPTSGIVKAQALPGRTLSATMRFDF